MGAGGGGGGGGGGAVTQRVQYSGGQSHRECSIVGGGGAVTQRVQYSGYRYIHTFK